MYTYILTNHTSMLYVGMTDDIRRRVFEHKTKFFEDGFTAKYQIDQLVYYEEQPDGAAAAARETQLKGWTRKKKMALVEKVNPKWIDLSDRWFRSEDLAFKYWRELDGDDDFSPSKPRLSGGFTATLDRRNDGSPTTS